MREVDEGIIAWTTVSEIEKTFWWVCDVSKCGSDVEMSLWKSGVWWVKTGKRSVYFIYFYHVGLNFYEIENFTITERLVCSKWNLHNFNSYYLIYWTFH